MNFLSDLVRVFMCLVLIGIMDLLSECFIVVFVILLRNVVNFCDRVACVAMFKSRSVRFFGLLLSFKVIFKVGCSVVWSFRSFVCRLDLKFNSVFGMVLIMFSILSDFLMNFSFAEVVFEFMFVAVELIKLVVFFKLWRMSVIKLM